MSLLYVNDSGATIGIEGNCCTVKQLMVRNECFP